MSVENLVIEFHICLEMIRKLDMNNELKCLFYLKKANLNSHDRILVVGAAGGDYYLLALATSLMNAFCTEELPPATTSTTNIVISTWFHQLQMQTFSA